MKAKVQYWNTKDETIRTETGFCYKDTKSVITKTEEWEGTEDEIFTKFYKANNRLRYCNGSYYKFEDINLQKDYSNWFKSLSEAVKFDLYYGNGVVD